MGETEDVIQEKIKDVKEEGDDEGDDESKEVSIEIKVIKSKPDIEMNNTASFLEGIEEGGENNEKEP